MKRFVLMPKPFITTLVLAILFLFSTVKSFAATKTWGGTLGTTLNWTDPTKWMGGVAPANGDDIVFNTAGVMTFTTMPAGGVANYNSLTISAGTVTLSHSSALVLTIGSVSINPTLLVNGGTTLIIGTNINVTLATNASAKVDGTLTINTGRTYNTNGTGVGTSVFGAIYNAGTITSSTSKLYIGFNGIYYHTQDAGVIPDATWDGNSFCIITGMTNTHPTGASQPFGNLSYDCAGMAVDITMPASVSIAKDFTVNNTNTKKLLMTAGSFSVGGNFNLPSNGNFTISGVTNRTLTVAGGAFIFGGNLDMCNGGSGNVGTLNVAGNFTNFGTITESGTGSAKGVINFNGSTAQTFNQSGTLSETIDLGINNPAGVTLAGSIAIDINDLTLSNGILNVPATTTLRVQSGNQIGGAPFGTTKYINTQFSGAVHGFVRLDNMAALTAYTIPVGSPTSYLPVILTPTTAASSFSVGAFTGITEDGLPNGTAFTPAKKAGVVDAVWTINRNSGTSADMTLAWPTALEGSSFATYTTTQIGISHWDGPNWGTSVGTGNNGLNTATRPGVSVFSPFGVGKTPYLLPVKFSYLNVAKGNSYNSLNWKASCNSSEVTFAVERSTDGRNFSEISSITASQSRCAQPFDYVDNNNLSGTVFYRIRSTEITGVITYSNIAKVTDQQKDMLLVGVSPNPVVSQAVLNINTTKKDIVELVVISMEGKIIQRSNIQLQVGSSMINLDVDGLQKGVYMIKGTFSNGQTNTVKFTKQ